MDNKKNIFKSKFPEALQVANQSDVILLFMGLRNCEGKNQIFYKKYLRRIRKRWAKM